MSPLPGHTVVIGERAAAPVSAGSTANGFMVGIAERGPATAPLGVVSLADFVSKYGNRVTGFPTLYDSVDAAFREGASLIYIGRAVGEGAKTSQAKLEDSGGKKVVNLTAESPGEWGNSLKVKVEKSGGEATIIVERSGTVVESIGGLTSIEAIVNWANNVSQYVNATVGEAGEAIPKAQTVELKEGEDKNSKVEQAQLETALGLFARDRGPGQVAAPGFTTEAIHKAILKHCDLNNRRALLDLTADTEAELVARGTALRGQQGSRYGMLLAPHAVIPGLTKGTTRSVPYSAIQMGVIARNDAEGRSPGEAAAGKRAICQYATGLSASYTDAQREALNNAGVTVAILRRGLPMTYGNRTLTNPTTDPDWLSFAASRIVMTVAALADLVLEDYEFDQIDGHGYVFRDLAADLNGRACMPLYLDNALYGQTPDEAFAVNTGPEINTPQSISEEKIKAQIAIRTARTGEMLTVEIVKVPTTEALP